MFLGIFCGQRPFFCTRFTHRYSPARPYWEAVLLAKKFVLIMASTTVIKDPLAQALIGTATNLAYLVLFEVKRP